LCIRVAPGCAFSDGERKTFLETSGIEYFNFESASLMYVWNKQAHKFIEFPPSD